MQILNLVLAAVITIYIILIFPIFVNIHAFFCKKTGKLYFGIYVFGVIKIISGYAHTCAGGYVIHLSDKKAVFTPYSSIFEIKNTVAPLKDYHVIKLDWFIEIGSIDSVVLPLSAAYCLNFFNTIAKKITFELKPYVKINNGIAVYEDKEIFNFYIKSVVVLNILMLLISIIKILTEKLLYVFRERKQNQ